MLTRDPAARTGITINEMFDEVLFENKLRALAYGYKKRYGALLKYDVDEELERFKKYREDLRVRRTPSASYCRIPLIAHRSSSWMPCHSWYKLRKRARKCSSKVPKPLCLTSVGFCFIKQPALPN